MKTELTIEGGEEEEEVEVDQEGVGDEERRNREYKMKGKD